VTHGVWRQQIPLQPTCVYMYMYRHTCTQWPLPVRYAVRMCLTERGVYMHMLTHHSMYDIYAVYSCTVTVCVRAEGDLECIGGARLLTGTSYANVFTRRSLP
jgi:hypothetical protein